MMSVDDNKHHKLINHVTGLSHKMAGDHSDQTRLEQQRTTS